MLRPSWTYLMRFDWDADRWTVSPIKLDGDQVTRLGPQTVCIAEPAWVCARYGWEDRPPGRRPTGWWSGRRGSAGPEGG